MVDVPLLQIDGLDVTLQTTDPAENNDAGTGTEARAGSPRPPRNLSGISLTIGHGEFHAIVGPPGSGRSALAAVLLGSPRHRVTAGRILFRGDDITTWATDSRARAGLFLAFRHPQEIAGVTILSLLGQALGARRGNQLDLPGINQALLGWMERLGIDPELVGQAVNHGLPPVERRRHELLQVAMLEPDLVVLDGLDAELDDDLIGAIADGIRAVRAERPSLGTLAITHCQRLLDHPQPDQVHVMVGGRIVASGGPELASRLETEGYESFT